MLQTGTRGIKWTSLSHMLQTGTRGIKKVDKLYRTCNKLEHVVTNGHLYHPTCYKPEQAV
jgi:hypothetical protein